MIAIKNIVTNIVVYLFPDGWQCEITNTGMITPEFVALDIQPSTHIIETNVPEPDLYVSGALKYDNGWAVVDQSAVDTVKTQITEKRIVEIVQAMESLFDITARSRGYDSRITCALRAGYPGPFQAEGLAFASWMDTCNATAYQMLAQVQAGTMAMPATTSDALALLPEMVWP